MTFLTPAALLLLAAAPLAALLLGRGLRRRSVRIAAFPLLAGLVDALPLLPRSHVPRRRLQVLLFVGAVALAAVAAGGPVIGAAGDPPRRAAVVIDDLSLWRDANGRLAVWDALLDEAARVAASFRADDRVLLVRTGAGLVGDGPMSPRRAAAAIRDLRPALAPAGPGAAGGPIAAVAAAHDAPFVRIVTADPGRWTAEVAGRGRWAIVGVPLPPGPRGNHGLLDVELRPDFFTPGRVALFCRVGAFGRGAGDGPLTLRVTRDGTALAERTFTLGPGQTRAETFADLDAGSGLLRVEVHPRDRFPDDDLYLAPLRERPVLPIELVTEGNAPLEAALRAVPGVELAVGRTVPAGGGSSVIRVFDRLPPPQDRGPLLVIAPPQGMPGLAYRGDAVEPREVRAAGAGSLLRGVSIAHLRPKRLPILALPSGVEAILTADGHPLVAAGKAPGGSRLALIAFDPAESGWTRDPSYPILVANLVGWLAEDSAETRSSLLVGERLPAGLAREVRTLRDPTGVAAAEPAGGWAQFRFLLPGSWRVDGSGPADGGEIFVNLLDETVSAAMVPPDRPAAVPTPDSPTRPFRADARAGLLAAAIALLVVERLVAPRRTAGRLP